MKRQIDIETIKEVASALGELNEKTVFVGGAVVSLYVNDPAADEVRPTKDIDIALEIVSLGQLERLRQDLAIKGFFPDPEETVICRFVYKDIRVDVMSTNEVGWVTASNEGVRVAMVFPYMFLMFEKFNHLRLVLRQMNFALRQHFRQDKNKQFPSL